jgi:hypothetical protein
MCGFLKTFWDAIAGCWYTHKPREPIGVTIYSIAGHYKFA